MPAELPFAHHWALVLKVEGKEFYISVCTNERWLHLQRPGPVEGLKQPRLQINSEGAGPQTQPVVGLGHACLYVFMGLFLLKLNFLDLSVIT